MSRQRGKASVVVGLRYDAMREEGQPRHLPFRLQIVSLRLPHRLQKWLTVCLSRCTPVLRDASRPIDLAVGG